MDFATLMSVVQVIFAALDCEELKEMCSIFGYKEKLDELRKTVTTIRAAFVDAENKEVELSGEAQHWIQELKDAVYDADDLLDEFVTLAKQKELIKGGKASKKVRVFFSRYNPLGTAYKMSQRVKKIRKNLDTIANIHQKFSFKVNSEPIRRRREETCSYVYEDNKIIGREKDVQNILDHMLDDSTVRQDVSFLSIVGIGGLGKTALAQLLYKHPRVKNAFTLKLWACVSDHDQQHLDVEQILRKILTAATGEHQEGSTKEVLHKKVREQLISNKYFLVLDDVWNESRNDWLKLVEFLLGGQRGSWIVVTTRSHKTATSVGGTLKHQLQGLCKKNSWQLFKHIAFESEKSPPSDNLVRIGEEILKQCAGVPLAIRVVGSLLYGREESEWRSFKEIGLSKHRESERDIIPILKFSYNQLESPLKRCFTYCALFPKDTVIQKELLITLWIAHDYVVPYKGQSIEDAAQEYYSILLRRCFFEDVKIGSYGEIVSCKIHDLMHDLAKKVAGEEICVLDFVDDDEVKKSRHLAYIRRCEQDSFFSNTCIRSYLYCGPVFSKKYEIDQVSLKALFTNWKRLRVLDLTDYGIRSLPESIGELLHLRYLDLSFNYGLEVLPKSITKLYNLQSLNLCNTSLKELPKDLRRLVNLRILNINLSYGLNNMPEGMSELTHLQVLPRFVIDGSKLSQQRWLNQLGELGKLDKLKGELDVKIKVGGQAKEVAENSQREEAYLKGKQHLNRVRIRVEGEGDDEGKARLLEQLQPHPNLKDLQLDGYNTDPMMRMPGWANNLTTSLPNLIKLRVIGINVECLTCLGNLPHLKVLELVRLNNLEYIYEDSAAVATSNEATTSMPHNNGLSTAKGLGLFPCLEQLVLAILPKLKGWRNSRVGVADNNKQQQDIGNTTQLSLSKLRSLNVTWCPDLISSLLCPNLEDLRLEKFNRKLKLIIDDEETGASASTSSSSYVISKLRRVTIDDVSWLDSIPREAFQCLREFNIRRGELMRLGEVEEIFRACSSSLQYLEVSHCPNIKSVWRGGLEHLIVLKELDIEGCPNVTLSGNEDTGDNISKCLKSLRSLRLSCASQLADLGHCVHFLEALQFLAIDDCQGLESLPNWMPKLSSLRALLLYRCSESLKERCQHTTGQDWPYIKHIPSIQPKVAVMHSVEGHVRLRT